MDAPSSPCARRPCRKSSATPACSSCPAIRSRWPMQSASSPTTRRAGATSATLAGVARRRATPGIASPRATSVSSPVRRPTVRSDALPAKARYLHHVGDLTGAPPTRRRLLRQRGGRRVHRRCAGPARGAFPAALAADGVPTLPLAFPPLRRVGGVRGVVRRLLRLVREQGIALLHANGPQTNVPAALAG